MPVDSDLALLFGMPGIIGSNSTPANNAPVIDLAGTDVRSDKSVSSLVGTTSVSPLTTAQALDVDGSDLNSITLQISGILDAEETLTIGDAVIDLSADASDTTEILGVTFAIDYVQATGVLTIAEVDDALLDESDQPILDESDQPVLAEA